MSQLFSRVFKLLGVGILALSVASIAVADDDDDNNDGSPPEITLKALLSNAEVPITIKMGAMDKSWRRFVATGNSASDMQRQLMGAATGTELGVHFTRGQSVNLAGETYLIAYRLPVVVDPRFLNWHGHGDPPLPRKPNDHTEMSLSLLNLRTMESLNDLRPFDPAKDMENTEQSNAASVRTLTQLGQGVMRYIKARGKLPLLRNPIPWDAGRAFYPYVGDERLYMHPSTQEMYCYNETLRGKQIKHIADRKNMALFYEASNGGDGTRGVLFLDGHVERASPARWAAIRKFSKITRDTNGGVNSANDFDEEASVSTTVVNAPAPPPAVVTSGF